MSIETSHVGKLIASLISDHADGTPDDAPLYSEPGSDVEIETIGVDDLDPNNLVVHVNTKTTGDAVFAVRIVRIA